MKSDSAAISVASTDAAAKSSPEMEESALESETKKNPHRTVKICLEFIFKNQQQQQNKTKQNKQTNKKRAYFAGEFYLTYGVMKQVHRYVSSWF